MRTILVTAATLMSAVLAFATPDARSDAPKFHLRASNNCGAIALHQLTTALRNPTADTCMIDAAAIPTNGFSMTDLLNLSAQAGLELEAVELPADAEIPVPSVVHWKKGHFSAIVEKRENRYRLGDASFGKRWVSASEIRKQSSGNFLVSQEKMSSGWKCLSVERCDDTIGSAVCYICGYDTNDCGADCCTSGDDSGNGDDNAYATPAASCSCGGMAVWNVSEPYVSLWLFDEPFGYNPGVGHRISFRLAYSQRDAEAGTLGNFSCGEQWNCSWVTYFNADSQDMPFMKTPLGRDEGFTADGMTPAYYSSGIATSNVLSGALVGYNVTYPDGSQDQYGFAASDSSGDSLFYRTASLDPAGHATRFYYTNAAAGVLLNYVVDADGRTNTLTYTNSIDPTLITGISNGFGWKTVLQYSASSLLTNVIDVVGISSGFVYDDTQVITNLITPYGTTTFNYSFTSTTITRSMMVVDPIRGTNFYAYAPSVTFLPASYAVPTIPLSAPPLCNADSDMTANNSWHWGPIQFAQLSTQNPNDFLTGDYLKARQRHWLAAGTTADALEMQQEPSPDGVATGQQTWFSYNGVSCPYCGTTALRAVQAAILPDGNSRYQWIQRNFYGHRTNVQETYSLGFGTTALVRTNIYNYYANGIDLQQHIGPLGETVEGYSYDANHDVLTATNAVGYVATNTYDSQHRLTSVNTPSGLTITNIYFSSGGFTNWVATNTALQIHRTNIYSYSNDLVTIWTNELGLVTTNTYDNLQRLTGVQFPDGTHTSNVFANLDRIKFIDRLGNTTLYQYDGLRHLTAVTNALNNVTRYNYCTCGSLQSVEDALGNLTTFSYDIAGRLTYTAYPDGTSLSNNFNLLNEIISTVDGSGIRFTNWYTDNGLLYASSNAAGRAYLKAFDIEDRLTNNMDQNGVVTTNSYDYLKRLLVRGYPDGGMEKFAYSQLGLVAYTNQLTNATHYAYDAAMRRIAETNALTNVTRYAYNAANQMTIITNQNNDTTQWGYDPYGRVTNKVDATGTTILEYDYDADNRLTNRWSVAKTNTAYAYDGVGNLRSVTYQNGTQLTYSYDANNWLTNMGDAVGTTSFTYTKVGQLASETGPWVGDAVSYTYTNRLRAVLSLQQPNASPWVQDYGYDLAARMTNVSSPAGAFGYAYDAGLGGANTASALLGQVSLPNGAWISNTFDNNGRMLGTWLSNSIGSNFDSAVYTYNVGNQRTTVNRTGENKATYGYDALGEVVSDTATEVSGGGNRNNEQLHYVFDAAGNLLHRTNNLLTESFSVNNLNELTDNTNGGSLTVVGTTTSLATNVTVNDSTIGSLYNDATFAAAGLSIQSSYTAVAADRLGRRSTNAVNVSLSASNTSYVYDGNGNLLYDGRRTFVYDDENQLSQVLVSNQWRSQFTYDGMLRRRVRLECTWQAGTWIQTNAVYYVYDGTVVIQERNSYNLPTMTYTRGLDLSSSLQGADGIGGLLAMTLDTAPGLASSNSYYYHSDGNGNVTMLINGRQFPVATYLYDAFGNVLSAAGSLAMQNLYRFSSKEAHINSGLVYYPYRFYDPNLQRWINRDPIQEIGGVNLYAFVFNCVVNAFDVYGLDSGNPEYVGLPTYTPSYAPGEFPTFPGVPSPPQTPPTEWPTIQYTPTNPINQNQYPTTIAPIFPVQPIQPPTPTYTLQPQTPSSPFQPPSWWPTWINAWPPGVKFPVCSGATCTITVKPNKNPKKSKCNVSVQGDF